MRVRTPAPPGGCHQCCTSPSSNWREAHSSSCSLARSGQDISGRDYWLETPYCPSDTLVRYAARDGHLYFGAAEVSRVVRPVLEICRAEIAGGSGSLADPFRLN